MTSSDNDAVDKWLSHLDELQPHDGRLTKDVMAAAGDFPVYKPPGDAYDNRNDPEKPYQHHKGTVARVYAVEMAKFRATMATSKAVDAEGEAADALRVKARYWSEITALLKALT